MQKSIALLLCFLMLFLMAGCTDKSQPAQESSSDSEKVEEEMAGISITFINEVEEADFWILPQTEKILKTTVWGTATIGKLQVGGEVNISLEAPVPSGLYIFRVIDTDEMYYETNDLPLKDGYSIRFYEDKSGYMSYFVEVKDETGNIVDTFECFAAHL